MDSDLKIFIQNSSLSDDDKVLWAKAFERLTEDQIKIVQDHISGDEKELGALTEEIRNQLNTN